MSAPVLHSYWRSTASYRVRIALALKGIEHEQVFHDLRKGEQGEADYLALNPQGLVPLLETGEGAISQSPAILEWIEEMWPNPPLLPAVPMERARVRSVAAIIGCDIHPLNNLRVLQSLRSDFHADEQQVNIWIARWIAKGFAAIEQVVAPSARTFAFGDAPTLADCCLIPQVYSAARFDIDLEPYPTIRRINANCAELPPFQIAHPSNQPDTDRLTGSVQ